MLIDNTYTLINQIVFVLKFDDGVTKTVNVSTDDVVDCDYANNGMKCNIRGRVDRIGVNSNSSLGHVSGSIYLKIDGSEDMNGNVVYVRPGQILDITVIETTCKVVDPICSVSNEDQKVILIRENELGILQYTKDGMTWRDISNGNSTVGMSAYEVAIAFGFDGSEEEWLTSLKGEKGEAGTPGKSVKPDYIFESSELAAACADKVKDGTLCAVRGTDGTAYLYVRSEVATMTEGESNIPEIQGYVCVGSFAQGPDGPKGEKGDKGERGETGDAGISIHACTQDAYLNASIELKYLTGNTSVRVGDIVIDCYGEVFEIKDVSDTAVIIGKSLFKIGNGEGGEGVGADGKSAYQVALNNGFVGTEEEWLASLVGPKGDSGKSAYQIAVDGGFTGTEEEWLTTIKGEKGDPGEKGDVGDTGATGADGESAYQVAVNEGFNGTKAEWLASLKGEKGDAGDKGDIGDTGATGADGKSAYQVAVDGGFTGTEVEWLETLKGQPGEKGDPGENGAAGVDGADGKSAYQIAVDEGFTGTEVEWLASLKGEKGDVGPAGTNGTDGKSAYQYAVDGGYSGTEEEFTAAIVKASGALTEDDIKNLGYAKTAIVNELPVDPDPNTIYFIQDMQPA